MTVYVKLTHSATGKDAQPQDWDEAFDDLRDQVLYEYEVMPSGTLRVFRVFPDGSPSVVDTAYGPGAWAHAKGTYLHGTPQPS
jgi:hypothetical protein